MPQTEEMLLSEAAINLQGEERMLVKRNVVRVIHISATGFEVNICLQALRVFKRVYGQAVIRQKSMSSH